MSVYIVISREKGIISVWKNPSDAEDARTKQYNQEKFSGGGNYIPGVWIEEKYLN